jgi:hypothetical protein
MDIISDTEMETQKGNWQQEFDQNEEEEEVEDFSQEQNTLADFEFEYEDEEEEVFEQPALETLYTSSQKHEQGLQAEQEEQPQQPLSEEQEAILYLEHIKELLQAKNIDFDAWLQEMQSRESDDWWWPDAEDVEEDPQPITESSEESSKIDYTPTPKPPPKKLMGMKSFRYLESRVLANFI